MGISRETKGINNNPVPITYQMFYVLLNEIIMTILWGSIHNLHFITKVMEHMKWKNFSKISQLVNVRFKKQNQVCLTPSFLLLYYTTLRNVYGLGTLRFSRNALLWHGVANSISSYFLLRKKKDLWIWGSGQNQKLWYWVTFAASILYITLYESIGNKNL